MSDKYANYSEEEMRLLSESYSKINVWRDGKKIVESGVIIDDKLKSALEQLIDNPKPTQ